MKVTPKWVAWASRMTGVRLHIMEQQILEQANLFGKLEEVDELMLKVVRSELTYRAAQEGRVYSRG